MERSNLHRVSSPHSCSLTTLVLAAAAVLAISTTLAAQTPLTKLKLDVGLVENVESAADPTQRYALLLPPGYQPDRTAPLMLLMDPRGRAMVPLELFRAPAEKYGFVVMSSYNTLSDSDSAFAVNDKAVAAMLFDAQSKLKVDPKRLYLVGFSGTAHYAWNVAPRLDGKLAGIMGVGGGLPAYSDPIQRALNVLYPFVYFGVAGLGDFNFDGVRYLDQSLDSTQFAHRFMTHDGDHEWPPDSVAAAAVEWFQLQAMGSGLIPRDDGFVNTTLERHLAEAAALDANGRKADAYRRYREIVSDFAQLGGSAGAEKAFRKLDGDRTVNRELDRRAKFMKQVIEYKLDVREFYLDYREKDPPPDLENALRTLKVEKLKKQAESDDREEAFAAKRMLASAFVNTAFYEPRDYFKAADYRRADGMLRIAESIQPGAPRVCYQRARAEAQLGLLDEAFRAIECAVEAEWVTRELLESDPLLAPLRADQRFATTLAEQ